MSNGGPHTGSSMCVGERDVYDVESGSTPSRSAVSSAMTLKEEPGWRWPWAARLNFDLPYSCEDAIATMSPLRGSMETIAEDGPTLPMVLAIAARASFCF